MLQKVVVVELHSQSKTRTCWKCQSPIPEYSPLCSHCNSLQEYPSSGYNYFAIFGLEPEMQLNQPELQKRYYRLAQMTHPDQYAVKGAPETVFATEWTSAINKAYKHLREKESRSAYIVELFGVPKPRTSQIPQDLTETYFELQELLSSGESAQDTWQSFQKTLSEQMASYETQWAAIAEEWHKQEDKMPLLTRLQDLLQKKKYLRSMQNDLNVKMGVFSGDSRN